MASIKFDEYRVKLHNLSPVLEDLGKSLGLEAAEQELDLLQAQSAAEDFWSNMEKAQKVSQRIKNLQDKIEAQNKRLSTVEDLLVLCEMGLEEDDDELLDELESTYAALEADIESARLSTLFRGEYDHNDCMLSIHAGAGGTEAQDWAAMLFRMYQRWADRRGFKCETLDYEDGDEAGIKTATLMISGENAYGYLRSEHGVHRLVRISP
ncbi:MAG: PCRF domain-containing protein, partial [Clostridiales bacterium]|nr:PCRF domain-containing protein [Clostridiales bacterium]